MILYGKPVAEKIYGQLKQEITKLQEKKFPISFGAILVGENLPSLKYIAVKEKAAQNLGIDFKLFQLPAITSQKKVEELIESLNTNKFISGIVVQLPLPEDFETDEILEKINKNKDVDGFLGSYPAPTAQAILEILSFYKIDLKNKKIVIIGKGRLVGRPLEKILKDKHLNYKICDSKTENLEQKTLQADILISATGEPGLIRPEMVKKEAVIIDAGTAESNGKLTGDVDQKVYEKVEFYTPTPGGVGPVTVACLLKNVVEAAKNNQ
jgi:methylenetetrahydrofolate dehydrogenase (NADP+)/methenyltetrahydrofolate cyclohydrolase